MTKARNDWDDAAEASSAQLSPRRELKKKRTGCSWSDADYNLLVALVRQFGEDWPRIARRFHHKSAKQCMQKFKNSQRSGKKGNWSKEEDDLLVAWVARNGSTKWTECSKFIVGRCGKQCRERWVNILNPDIKKGDWSDREQDLIFAKLPVFLTSWSLMAGALTGRTENSIKNYFYSSIRRLKSNPAVTAIRDVHLDHSAERVRVFTENPGLGSEIEKLNTLSRRIVHFLLGPEAGDQAFRDFLLSVIFGTETDPSNLLISTIQTQDSGKENTPQKPAVPVSVFPCADVRPPSNDSNLVVPRESFAPSGYQSGFQPIVASRPPSVAALIETMKRISEVKNCFDFSVFISFLETQVKDVQVTGDHSKVVLRLPTCLNCHNDCCRANLLGV